MAKILQTEEELKAHLAKQIAWIERSAAAFDEGYEDEAGRLAVTIRVLVHDTKASHSLLDQLGQKNIQFYDGALPPTFGNLAPDAGLVMIAVGKDRAGTRFLPVLDDSPIKRGLVAFDQWWNDAVFIRPGGAPLSRKSLVLTAANQDGGAHVDPSLDEDYKALQTGEFLNWSVGDATGENVIAGAEKAAIRQIAHELLRTLNPSMRRMIPNTGDAAFLTLGGGITEGSVPQLPGLLPFPADRKPNTVGRNERCPCGSGRKFKHCHGPYLA